MVDIKYYHLVKKIYEQTINSTIEWKETSDPEIFQCIFPENTIRIEILDSIDEPESLDIKLSIYDQAGKLIQSIRDPEIKEFGQTYDMMKELYNRAKSIARGVDKSIDNILNYLDKIGKSSDDDDDLRY